MPSPLMNSRVRENSPEYDGQGPLDTLECIIERITFHNAENGYSVVKVTQTSEDAPKSKGKTRANDDVITVLGAFSNPVVGEALMCWGRWIKHPQYGAQFKLERYETMRPATAVAIEKYLGSGMVKGIGPVMAKRIVAKFGEAALDVIEQTPEKLTKVSGLGEKRVEMIRKAWDEQREVRNIMLFLQGHGVSPTYAVKIYRHYKERAIEVVERNPYQLATDIWGIGFKSADKIAQNVGMAPDAPERLEAGLVYVLNQEMDGGGHCFLLENDLIKKAAEILLPQTHPDGDEEADKTAVARMAAIERSLSSLIERELLVAETVEFMGVHDTAIYTPSIHTTEKAVAERVNTLLSSPWRSRPKPAELDGVAGQVKEYAMLSDEQKQAVRRALSEPLMVLTGGPGTGKCVVGDTLVLGADGLRPIREHWAIANGQLSVNAYTKWRHDKTEGSPDSFIDYRAEVLGRLGPTQTSHAYYGGFRETRRLQTQHGFTLEGTPNHRIWGRQPDGEDGWLCLADIHPVTFVALRAGSEYWPADGQYFVDGLGRHFASRLPENEKILMKSALLKTNRETALRLLSIIFNSAGRTLSEGSGKVLESRDTIFLRTIQLLLLNLGVLSGLTEGEPYPYLDVTSEDWEKFEWLCRDQQARVGEHQFWDRVTTVEESVAEVFDLSVPGDHSFVANGFINHNTTTTRAIVSAFEKLGKRIQIASPTGRAAKRASEVTGREAKTIHRMLAFDPEKKGFKHGPGEPLELDVLIVDESSMLDLVLTHHTLRAVPDGAQVIFVGDVDQLPSVGPGNVLADLINSGRVPVAKLTQVFRQAAESKIITNAHAINRGKMPELPPPSSVKDGIDCVFLEVEESEEIPTKIAAVVAKSLPRLGYAPNDITVLAPMQRGTVGARHLNEVLQSVLNPPHPDKAEYQRGPLTFRVGDRVMQRVNNYDKNVFNGDVGSIGEIDKENQTVAVLYPEGPIEYDFVDMDQLNHAAAISIHKSQGSEYPACIIALHTQHYMMLQRNLVYTALTRAKKIAVFIGSKRAIQMAVRNRNVVPRNTRLAARLQMLVDDLGPDGRARARSGAPARELPTPPLPGRLL